ncbi:MAG TPA: efflux RND transporter periplasmic adaptor subunit [Bacteroidales bacterium]|nr:efflux RND transporter periplasmic adaptor subunit [Bacteroidales bacterium]
MDREISIEVIKKQRKRRVIVVAAVCLSLVVVFGAFRSLMVPVLHRSDIETAVAVTGDMDASIMASGMVLPEFEEVIVSPVTSRILKVNRNVGEMVKEGDMILSLDKSADEMQLSRMLEELASKQNQKKKLQLNIESTLTELQTNYEIQRLKGASLLKSYENEQYLKTLGGTTEEMVKLAELNSKISQLEVQHLGESITNKKATLEADLKDQEYKISIYQKEINELKKRIDDSDIKASGNGVVIWINDKIGSTVSAGGEVVKLANLTSFKVEGNINDINSGKLALGRKVKVYVGDSVVTGMISAVNPTVENDNVKFVVSLDRKDNPLLRSNQKVDISIITSHKKNAVLLPRQRLVMKGANPYLFILKEGEALRRTVKLGEGNFDYIEVLEGIKAGDEVIISDMEDRMHMQRIRVKE